MYSLVYTSILPDHWGYMGAYPGPVGLSQPLDLPVDFLDRVQVYHFLQPECNHDPAGMVVFPIRLPLRPLPSQQCPGVWGFSLPRRSSVSPAGSQVFMAHSALVKL